MDFPKEKVNMVLDAFKVENVRKNIISNYDNFGQWDEHTQFHGRHISSFNGMPNTYAKLFNKRQIKYIESHFQRVMNEFGYDCS